MEIVNIGLNWLSGLTVGEIILYYIVVAIPMAYIAVPYVLWLVLAGSIIYALGLPMLAWQIFAVFALVTLVRPLRRNIISRPLFSALKALNLLPVISETEQAAIDAGTVWIDGELFSGKPNFKRILKEEVYPTLSAEEQAFLDGPVNKLCAMVDDFKVTEAGDFPKKVWDFIKKEKFFGMIIQKKYGGLEFSALGHSEVIAKLASRSTALAITVMVPNSLGPAELLTHYGTQEQKDYYLPRLADGIEVPCFGLTEPRAGSDAGAMSAAGEVFKAKDGTLMIRLNWSKRYITLSGISTVIGLAFKLNDPKKLLGKGEHLGITCALIPSNTKGVVLGRRHDPLGVPFFNCPTDGSDVEVPLSTVIGGEQGVGKGWTMLMESLAAGRGISLPSNCAGGGKLVTRTTGAYAAIRKQFGINIGKFEGIQEAMAQIGAMTYTLDASRIFTCGAIDQGAKPAVVTAICKYNATEIWRDIINHGMDILGGAAISRGPRNILANPYFATPISITVEGANILTRTLIVFGQGAIRCHPYVLQQVQALQNNDVILFDLAFWKHIGHVVRNKNRAIVLYFTRGLFSCAPVSKPTKKYIKKLNWASAKFALAADIALGTMGGELKRKEMLAGRFADVFSWMYLATATIRRFEAEGSRKEDIPFMAWSCEYALKQIQDGFQGLFANMGPLFAIQNITTRINPIGSGPSDKLSQKVAELMQIDGDQRDRLTTGIYMPDTDTEALGRLDQAFKAVAKTEPIAKKISKAIRKKQLPKQPIYMLIKAAKDAGIITAAEAKALQDAENRRFDAITVDDFPIK